MHSVVNVDTSIVLKAISTIPEVELLCKHGACIILSVYQSALHKLNHSTPHSQNISASSLVISELSKEKKKKTPITHPSRFPIKSSAYILTTKYKKKEKKKTLNPS